MTTTILSDKRVDADVTKKLKSERLNANADEHNLDTTNPDRGTVVTGFTSPRNVLSMTFNRCSAHSTWSVCRNSL
ncbi:hypothetical protein [Bradyrhizobium sp. Gha]|uniref:hypothetical protein n=1 Tax=Bradyrhizobium sp. Gha TaxID=1855318 RepID=UPI001FCD497C|nr:hypothetical protein [Bradyrhizobium sp. Gha]